MSGVPGYKAVLERYNRASFGVKGYFEPLPRLIAGFPLEISLAYVFLRVAEAQNRALYCGVVKRHRSSSAMAEKAVNCQHLTREGFVRLYETVFSTPISATTLKQIKEAEKV